MNLFNVDDVIITTKGNYAKILEVNQGELLYPVIVKKFLSWLPLSSVQSNNLLEEYSIDPNLEPRYSYTYSVKFLESDKIVMLYQNAILKKTKKIKIEIFPISKDHETTCTVFLNFDTIPTLLSALRLNKIKYLI